jgi:hypothetical protein
MGYIQGEGRNQSTLFAVVLAELAFGRLARSKVS